MFKDAGMGIFIYNMHVPQESFSWLHIALTEKILHFKLKSEGNNILCKHC